MTPERIMALGAELGWPAVRLQRAETLRAGERAWARYVVSMTVRQHERLVVAIQAGWSTDAGARGLVHDERE